jgi:predicted 3-demethylubiquinone-9 3-methyltransferase (glyoxalase superfamily)
MPTITPFLWFDGKLEEAVTFYTTVFPNVRVEA